MIQPHIAANRDVQLIDLVAAIGLLQLHIHCLPIT